MNLTIETDREDDGRWIAEVLELPGVMVYGDTAEDAINKVQVLALRVLAERLEESRAQLDHIDISLAGAA